MQRELTFFAVAVAAASGLNMLAIFAFGAPLEPFTVVLGLVAVALLYALRAMFHVVSALARPDVAATLYEHGATHDLAAERRDEQQRTLRAIKELEFDHSMGKLSDPDFEELLRSYRLRAVGLMRAGEGTETLHPRLAAELAARKASAEASAAAAGAESTGPEGPATLACDACGATNDVDARFCKRCGKELQP